MRDVAVVGAGMTNFGKFLDRSMKDIAGEAVKGCELDAVGDGHRPPRTRQENEEAARAHPAHAQHARRYGVEAVKVVQQPAVGTEPFQRFAECREVKAVQQLGPQWWRGSGGAARHSHAAAPVARHAV